MAGARPAEGMHLVEEALVLRPRTVRDLLNICRSRNSRISEEEILDAVRILSKDGRVVLSAPRLDNFGSFLRNPFRNTSLLVVLTVSVFSSLLYFIAGSFPWSLLQIVPGVLLLFYLPGHSLLRILLGQPGDQRLERIVFEIAASMVSIMLLGLLLNFGGLGLFSGPALGSVVFLDILLALGASYRDFSAN
jgi:uncharacterized membrane protein